MQGEREQDQGVGAPLTGTGSRADASSPQAVSTEGFNPSRGRHSTDDVLNAALMADAAMLASMGADPGPTIEDLIPGFGDFLDGLAARLEAQDPEGFAALASAIEAASAGETRSASTEGESAGPKDDAQPTSGGQHAG